MNWKRFVVAMFALLVSVVAASQPMWAQATVSSGNLQGTVTDAQGGVVANATVTISNKATGIVTNLTTNGSGTYSSGLWSGRVQRVGSRHRALRLPRLPQSSGRTSHASTT